MHKTSRVSIRTSAFSVGGVRCSISPMEDESGQPICAVEPVREINARPRNQEDL